MTRDRSRPAERDGYGTADGRSLRGERVLGDGGRPTRSRTPRDGSATTPRYRTVLVRVLYAAAVAAGLLLTGVLEPFDWFALGTWDASRYEVAPLAVPPHIYLYAYLGATAYVLIAWLAGGDRDVTAVVRNLLRIPAALLVAVGVYLLASNAGFDPLLGEPSVNEQLALMAYLAGLFIQYWLRVLATVSARLYPSDPKRLYFG